MTTARPSRRPLIIAIAAYITICGVLLGCALALNGGTFTYTLDDPYIHLSLARNILQGSYGMNSGEFAAPASSIIWPFLIAPFTALPIGVYAPLILSMAAAIGSITLLARMFAEAFGRVEARYTQAAQAILLIWLMVTANLIGLTFTGMEHNAQICCTLLILRGLLIERERRMVPWWLCAAIILAPLLRYECLVLSGLAMIYLLWRRHVGQAALCAGVIVVVMGAFTAMLASHGVGLLPSSVISKSSAYGTSVGDFLGSRLQKIFLSQPGLVLLACIAAMLLKTRSALQPVAWIMAATSAIHLLFGRTAGYPRYEMYLLASNCAFLIIAHPERIMSILQRVRPILATITLIIITPLVSVTSLIATIEMPIGSNNVYEQQFQMARFVSDYYQAPIAVNDIGLVTWGGKQPVLDLWGLASYPALQLRLGDTPDPIWMQQIAQQHDVHLVMIYSYWFKDVPPSWVPLGTLRLSRFEATVTDKVTFYATDEAAAQRVRAMLPQFVATLPPAVRFEPPAQTAP